jgi:hypothetical protein
MKKLILILIIVLCGSASYAGVDLPWSTTYDCDEWTQSDATLTCDSLEKGGGWTTTDGAEEQITSSANNSNGGGGRGQRHWEGDGVNNNSGGLRVTFNSVQSELWIRWYMRYESGFNWDILNYDKILYIKTPDFDTNGNIAPIIRWYGVDFSIYSQGVQSGINYGSDGYGWDDVMGGSTADGNWHCYEVHIKMDTNGNNGIGEAWIDEQKIISENSCDFGTQSGWSNFLIGSNQSSPDNGSDMAVDFDDIVVSNTGYIGPINIETIKGVVSSGVSFN